MILLSDHEIHDHNGVLLEAHQLVIKIIIFVCLYLFILQRLTAHVAPPDLKVSFSWGMSKCEKHRTTYMPLILQLG